MLKHSEELFVAEQMGHVYVFKIIKLFTLLKLLKFKIVKLFMLLKFTSNHFYQYILKFLCCVYKTWTIL